MQPTIILVAGYAASGKTRVGKELARRLANCCFLDKDTLCEPIVDRLVQSLGSARGDRDSDLYRQQVRPLEYQCLMATGIEIAELGTSALLCAPFVHQLTDAQWVAWLERGLKARGVRCRIIWVSCSRSVIRQRMITRGSPRDRAKIENWESYSAAIDEELPARIPADVIEFDNNDDSAFELQLCQLVDRLQRG